MSPVSTLSARRTTPRVALVAGLILTVAGPVAALPSDTRQPAPWNDRPAHTAAVRDPAAAPHAPRFFVANHGQRPDATVLYIGGPGREMALEPTGVTWIERVAVPEGGSDVVAAHMRFVGARPGVRPEGASPCRRSSATSRARASAGASASRRTAAPSTRTCGPASTSS